MARRNSYLKCQAKIGNKNLEFILTNSTIVAFACDGAGNGVVNHLTASHTETWVLCTRLISGVLKTLLHRPVYFMVYLT